MMGSTAAVINPNLGLSYLVEKLMLLVYQLFVISRQYAVGTRCGTKVKCF